ncbi:hypothetical protein FQR65_LT02049 [Abscondita terminalis]|nr:hypothetical protein FQR65_LT02049 [Abscondita terminalis]
MKTIVIAAAFMCVFFTYTNANSQESLDLQEQIEHLLHEIAKCVSNDQISNGDLSILLQKLKEWLQTFGGCFNINIDIATENDIPALLLCLLGKLDEASDQALMDIFNQLQSFKCLKKLY